MAKKTGASRSTTTAGLSQRIDKNPGKAEAAPKMKSYAGKEVRVLDKATNKTRPMPGHAYDLIAKETMPFGGRNRPRYEVVEVVGQGKAAKKKGRAAEEEEEETGDEGND